MAQTATILDASSLRRPQLAIADVPQGQIGTPANARLIPGTGNLLASAKEHFHPVMRDGGWTSGPKAPPSIVATVGVGLLPKFLAQFHPALLGAALRDVAVISLAFLLQSQVLASGTASGRSAPLNLATLGFFLATFLLFAIQEGLYAKCRKTSWAECGAAAKAILWSTTAGTARVFKSCRISRPCHYKRRPQPAPVLRFCISDACPPRKALMTWWLQWRSFPTSDW